MHLPAENAVALWPPVDGATAATPTSLSPPSNPLLGQVAALADIVSHLAEKMDQMEGRLLHTDSCPGCSNRDMQVTTPVTSNTAQPSLHDLRWMDPLNARIDALMGSAPNIQPDVPAMRPSNTPAVGATDGRHHTPR